MSFEAEAWAWKQKGLTTTQKIVLLCLSQHHNWKKQVAFPSIRTMAEECDLSDRAVQEALRALEAKKIIKTIPTYREDGSRSSNIYELLLAQGRGNDVHPPDEPSAPPSEPGSHLESGKEPGILTKSNPRSSSERTPTPEGFEQFDQIIRKNFPEGYRPSEAFWSSMAKYKHLDFEGEAYSMAVWAENNPHKKPRAKVTQFIRNWMSKAGKEHGRNGTNTPDIQRLRGGQGVLTAAIKAAAERDKRTG